MIEKLCQIDIIPTPEGLLFICYPVNNRYPMVRGFQYYKDKKKIDWEMLRPSQAPEDVSFLLEADEEMLFQLSCTLDYDVYERINIIKYMQERFNEGIHRCSVSTTKWLKI